VRAKTQSVGLGSALSSVPGGPGKGRNAQNTGRSPTERRTGQIDPEATFKIGPMNGREEGESGLPAEDVGLRRQTPDKGILSSQPRRRRKTAGRAGLRRFHPARINRARR
jgi:hypothetical protein